MNGERNWRAKSRGSEGGRLSGGAFGPSRSSRRAASAS
jgi:hypothetical protein